MSHPGVKETTRKVSERYYWPGIKKDINDYVLKCRGCLQAKDKRTIRPPMKPMPIVMPRFHDVVLDIVGPLTPSNSYRFLLTIVDKTSRWVEAVPMEKATAASCATAFLEGWVR